MSTVHINDALTPAVPLAELPTPAFVPVHALFLLMRDVFEDKTEHGIHIPQSVKETPQTGTVVVCGEEVTKVKRGDRIAFPPYAGTNISIDKQAYLLLDEKEVLGWLVRKE